VIRYGCIDCGAVSPEEGTCSGCFGGEVVDLANPELRDFYFLITTKRNRNVSYLNGFVLYLLFILAPFFIPAVFFNVTFYESDSLMTFSMLLMTVLSAGLLGLFQWWTDALRQSVAQGLSIEQLDATWSQQLREGDRHHSAEPSTDHQAPRLAQQRAAADRLP